MFIYQLIHEYWEEDFEPSGFRIGYYSDIKKLEEVRRHYLTLPGFNEHPEGFRIIRHIINKKSCKKVWVLDLVFDEYCDNFIALGVFESKKVAENFAEYYKAIKGNDVNDGRFMIEDYLVNKSNWQEGFLTYYTE